MKRSVFTVAVGLVFLTSNIVPVLAAAKPRALATMAGRDGKAMGTANFIATAHGVVIELDLKGLTPGAHAIHIHTAGNCDRRTAFTSAGPHFTVEPNRMHGFLAPHGVHAGDLPNQFAASDGTLHASVISNAISLGDGKKSIFDRDDAAIIVHAKADDYVSQPVGNSGDRVACGVIVRTVAPSTRKAAARGVHK